MGFEAYKGEIPAGKGGRTESAEMKALKTALATSLSKAEAVRWDGDGQPTKTALGRVRRAAKSLGVTVRLGQLDSGEIVFQAFALATPESGEAAKPRKAAKAKAGATASE